MKHDHLDDLFEILSSQTKSQIIALLAIQGKMTVTQISKHIKTSRSNLYQSISDLQEKGFVNPPEVIVQKNYVEKYYSLNESAFNETSQSEMDDQFKRMNPEKARDIIATFLLTQSLTLRVIAQEVRNSSNEEIKKIVEEGMEGHMVASFSTLSDEHFKKGITNLKPFLDYVGNPENFNINKKENEDSRNMILILALPSYLFGSLKKDLD
ncbi:winged helix-turn-helix domain-containing protein [Cuniculiplasma sp. SKW4]|uniref:winged helix-turn-helix domain-containing protein n=1 Tax=Cuniculiplasma sp. SKW4 TaxID=3400171 RepID=UPI003FD0A165